MRLEAEVLDIIAEAIPGASVESWEELSGGVSARAVVVALRAPDRARQRVVVRRPARDSAEQARRVVECEHALLSRLPEWGVKAPRPLHVDLARNALVLEYLEGTAELQPRHHPELLAQMAEALARLHSAPIDVELVQHLQPVPWESIPTDARELDASLKEAFVRAELQRVGPPRYPNAPALLHGDFWPGNLLWRSGQLAAILDWEESKYGDPLFDLAVARLDVLWVYGESAMQDFTERYRALSSLDFRDLARWDLQVALRPMGALSRWASAYGPPPLSRPDIDEAHLRAGHHRFVELALQDLNTAQ